MFGNVEKIGQILAKNAVFEYFWCFWYFKYYFWHFWYFWCFDIFGILGILAFWVFLVFHFQKRFLYLLGPGEQGAENFACLVPKQKLGAFFLPPSWPMHPIVDGRLYFGPGDFILLALNASRG